MDHNSNPRQEHSQFTIVRKLDDVPFPLGFKELLAKRNKKIEVVKNENALLNYLMGMYLFFFFFKYLYDLLNFIINI